MPIDGQMLVVLVLVAAATGYILRTTWRFTRGKSAGCCGKGCSSDQPAEGTNGHVVSSEELLQSLQRKQDRP